MSTPYDVERLPTYVVQLTLDDVIEEMLRRGHAVMLGRDEFGAPLWDLTPRGADELLGDEERERWARARGL